MTWALTGHGWGRRTLRKELLTAQCQTAAAWSKSDPGVDVWSRGWTVMGQKILTFKHRQRLVSALGRILLNTRKKKMIGIKNVCQIVCVVVCAAPDALNFLLKTHLNANYLINLSFMNIWCSFTRGIYWRMEQIKNNTGSNSKTRAHKTENYVCI